MDFTMLLSLKPVDWIISIWILQPAILYIELEEDITFLINKWILSGSKNLLNFIRFVSTIFMWINTNHLYYWYINYILYIKYRHTNSSNFINGRVKINNFYFDLLIINPKKKILSYIIHHIIIFLWDRLLFAFYVNKFYLFVFSVVLALSL